MTNITAESILNDWEETKKQLGAITIDTLQGCIEKLSELLPKHNLNDSEAKQLALFVKNCSFDRELILQLWPSIHQNSHNLFKMHPLIGNLIADVANDSPEGKIVKEEKFELTEPTKVKPGQLCKLKHPQIGIISSNASQDFDSSSVLMYVKSTYTKYTTYENEIFSGIFHTFLIEEKEVHFQEHGESDQDGLWPIDDWAENNLDMIPPWEPGWNSNQGKWKFNRTKIQRKIVS